MKIAFGEFGESAEQSIRILPYVGFIGFDISNAREVIPTNISVAEAKQVRDELDKAIKIVEEKNH
ncbi:hypothetical protein [Streptomyces sp. NPDC005281]|uniref:hypothetical protein n=1 Tax=Streptomyces sp. NPDC005281 TaxID=3155712 RepID=UPI0033BF93AF